MCEKESDRQTGLNDAEHIAAGRVGDSKLRCEQKNEAKGRPPVESQRDDDSDTE